MRPDELVALLDRVQVVDVRFPNEWEAGRIDGAVHIPGDDLADRADELDRDRPVVTVCRTGERSGWAAGWLRDEGFDADGLEGGMQAWAAAGLPFSAAGGGRGEVAESAPPPDDRPPEMQRLQDDLLSLIFAVSERFGDREPTEEELRGFLREHLVAEGRTPEEADEVLARMDEPDGTTGTRLDRRSRRWGDGPAVASEGRRATMAALRGGVAPCGRVVIPASRPGAPAEVPAGETFGDTEPRRSPSMVHHRSARHRPSGAVR